MPMDVLKTRLQSAQVSSTILEVAQSTLRDEGIRGFYRGLTYPMFGIGICSSIWFGVNFNAEQWFRARHAVDHGHGAVQGALPIAEGMLCGALAGFAGTFVLTPMERLKIYTQTHSTATGGLTTLNYLFRTQGIPGVFRGFFGTSVREAWQMAVYFPAYSFVRAGLISTAGASPDSWWLPLVGGAFAGNIMWLMSMPMDVTKTRVQSGQYENFREAYLSVWREGGVRGFWRGTAMACLRATPLHATIFFTYDNIYTFLNKLFNAK